jgi:hypothetical protein
VATWRACDVLTEIVIYVMVIFSPWAFGTTQPWSIWVMNVLGYVLGTLWLIRTMVCRFSGYSPLLSSGRTKFPSGQFVLLTLASSTIALLVYCLIGAINARATYFPDEARFEYYQCVNWLPHSFDSRSTWLAFWNYLALACAFWAIRDWLFGTSPGEEIAQWRRIHSCRRIEPGFLPERLRRLLWVLSINGSLLAVEGIVQRLANSPKLLFLVKPHIHQTASGQFGTFAYRANAAEYFNLLWPVCLGFWSVTSLKPVRKRHQAWLLGSALLMASCPVISTSRGGALVSLALLLSTGITFLFLPSGSPEHLLNPNRNPARITAMALFYLGTPALGLTLGWTQLQPRLESLGEGFNGRERICQTASQIAAQFPLFGTGPGTYASVSELYRPEKAGFWPAQVHNDWLETRITFGWVGSGLIGTAVAALFLSALMAGGWGVNTQFITLTWLALVGCLIHARFDFPFQVYSILFLFVVLCAVISVLHHDSTVARNKRL